MPFAAFFCRTSLILPLFCVDSWVPSLPPYPSFLYAFPLLSFIIAKRALIFLASSGRCRSACYILSLLLKNVQKEWKGDDEVRWSGKLRQGLIAKGCFKGLKLSPKQVAQSTFRNEFEFDFHPTAVSHIFRVTKKMVLSSTGMPGGSSHTHIHTNIYTLCLTYSLVIKASIHLV